MKCTAIIRTENKRAIYQAMLDGGSYTKNQIASMTGLSIPTCNTLLNIMEQEDFVRQDDKVTGIVGRTSLTYRINDEQECYLAIQFELLHGVRFIEYRVMSPLADIIQMERKCYGRIELSEIERIVRELHSQFSALSQIIVGVPSFIHKGRIHYCDISEMDGIVLAERLEKLTGVPVTMKNDMHYKAYGYIKLNHCQNEVISLGLFPSGVLPGTATIHKGHIIEGAAGAAGMTGFLSSQVTDKDHLKQWEGELAVPLIAQTIRALIVLMNPSRMVLCGDLINDQVIKTVKEDYLQPIPEEYFPVFEITDNFDSFYFEGMYQTAVDNKKF